MTPEPFGLAAPLGDLLARLARGGDPELLRRTVALLLHQRESGHVHARLDEWQRQALPGDPTPFPALGPWCASLAATGLCGDGTPGEPPLPLVLDSRHRLYLRRHHRAEQTVLQGVRARLAAPPLLPAAALRQALGELRLLPTTGSPPDWQLAAVAAAARCRFAVLTGGPGTGKTTTVARLLAVLWHLDPGLRVALCAPTGKAAARLGEALRERAAEFPALAARAAAMVPSTLHRLLGHLPLQDTFRHGPDQPLSFDLVVVDEVSMVDPAVLAVLLGALRPDARLLLVGDRDQLAAIAAGQVLGDLCRAARPEAGVGEDLAAFVREATGMELPVQPHAAPIADHTIALRTNHRFGRQPGLGGFAQALAARRADEAFTALVHGHADLSLEPDADAALRRVADALTTAARTTEPEAALAALSAVRVLCATRRGPDGVLAWNRRIEAFLARRGVPVDAPWYPGRPVLVLQNDPQNQVWNGDLGVCLPGPDGPPAVWFPVPGQPPRPLAVARLPEHETAWAMTVHKAQGSEFRTVLLAMPSVDGPLWSAPLVYTGVTRARERAIVVAAEPLLREALQRWPERGSGLAEGLSAPATSGGAPSTGA